MGPPMPELAYDFDRRGDIVPVNHRAAINAGTRDLSLQVLRGGAPELPLEPVTRAPMPTPLAPQPKPSDLTLDRSRDDLLTGFGKATLRDRYLLEGESYQDMFARVACAFSDDIAHAQRRKVLRQRVDDESAAHPIARRKSSAISLIAIFARGIVPDIAVNACVKES